MNDLFVLIIGNSILELCFHIWDFLSFNDIFRLRIINKNALQCINDLIYEKALKINMYFVINVPNPISLRKDDCIKQNYIRDYNNEWLPEKYLLSVLKFIDAPDINNKTESFVTFIKFFSLKKIFENVPDLFAHFTRNVKLNVFHQYPLIAELYSLYGYDSFSICF